MSEPATNGQFTPANAASHARNGHEVRKAQSQRTAYGQAVVLQELLLKDADITDLKPLVRCGIARAFVELEECKRKLKMKPLPKSIDVSKLHKAKSKRSAGPGFSEHPSSGHEPTTSSVPAPSASEQTPQEPK